MTGKVISHYRIIEKLDSGGMGIVYKAEDLSLKRTVALKFLPEEYSSRIKNKERFITEAQLISSLQHQNVCTVHEIDQTPDGQLYICMDYYDGETLEKKLSRALPEIEAILDITIQIIEGISRAHHAGIVHSDLKPANIMITQDGTVKILDFGLSRLAGNIDFKKAGKKSGTLNYLSPEQAQGKDVDQQTDIWALGIILYEMCTGRLPFYNEYEAVIIYSILDKIPEPPSEFRNDIPIKLEEIIFRCLRKEKNERYLKVEDLLADLEDVRNNLIEKHFNQNKKDRGIKRETERRLVTIVSTEIDKSVGLQNNSDEEELADLMNIFFEIHEQVARKYNGTLRKISAYNFMIIIGFPEASEESPRQATNLAIDLHKRISGLKDERKIEGLGSIKSGINTGEVIADELSVEDRTEYSVLGKTVDFATQLKNLSEKGSIMVGPLTYRYAKPEFEFKPVSIANPGNSDEHIIVYQLLSKRENLYRSGSGARRMIFSGIVGRDRELESLNNHLSELIKGRGSIVSIIGEAGIGKSRLIAEFRKTELRDKVKWLEGKALSTGRNLSFYPVIDLLRKFAGITEEDSEAISFEKSEILVKQIAPNATGEIFPFIATLMGFSLDGEYAERLKGIEDEALERLIIKNLKDFFVRSVESVPMVIIVEDLHWADISSISLLESLYRLAIKNKLLFINVLRPGYKETSDRILTTIRNRYPDHNYEIGIEPLDPKQTDTLLYNLLKLKNLPPGIGTKIKERTGGNPFFIEEVVRSMLDEGVIVMKQGSFRLSDKHERIVIPETITELLMARIDKLEENTRRLIKTAAVIGRNFFYKVLVEISDEKDKVSIDQILDRLKETQLILERKRMAEVEYMFKHALVQEAVYSTLIAKQRKELHFKVAKAIEKVFHDRLTDFYGTLAFHYTLADDLTEAENYLTRAGEKALKSAASTEAISYYKDALAIYRRKYGRSTDPGKIAMLEKNIATALLNRGHFIDAAVYFDHVLKYHGMNIPKKVFPTVIKVLKGILSILVKLTFPSLMGNKTPTREEVEIIEIIRDRGASLALTDGKRFVIEIISFFPWYSQFDVRRTDILVFVAIMFSFGGISQKFGRKVMNYYSGKYDKNDQAASFAYATDKFCAGLWTGHWDEMHYDEAVYNLGLKLGNLYFLVTYVGFQGHLLIERGEREAMRYLDKCTEISEMFDYDYGRLAKFTHGTLYFLKFRELDRAQSRADESISFIQKTIGNRPGLLMTLSLKVRVEILAGKIAEAEVTMKITDDLALADTYVPYFLSFYTTTRFMMNLHKLQESLEKGDKKQAGVLRKITLSSGRRAVKVSGQAAFERVETLRMMGIYYWITGNHKTGLKWWEKSVNEALRLNARLELSRTYMEAGKRLLDENTRGNPLENSKAEEYLTKARQLFTEMNLQWDKSSLDNSNSWNII